jgi:hypothetical protein
MPGLSVVKVSRQSGKGQMENGGKRKRKTNGMNEKSKWTKCAEFGAGRSEEWNSIVNPGSLLPLWH